MATKTKQKNVAMEFEWQPGKGHSDVDPQVVGETILEIERRDGTCSAQALVDEAASAASPLHNLFEWDDTAAAKQWRVEQARLAIRSIRFVVRREEVKNQHVMFVSTGSGYSNVIRVVSDEKLRQKMLDDAIKALNSWRERYGHLQELEAVVQAIGRI